jgi:hypothetical protein
LDKRIRNGSLLLLFIALGLGTVSLPQVYRLGGAIRQTLYNNYSALRLRNTCILRFIRCNFAWEGLFVRPSTITTQH